MPHCMARECTTAPAFRCACSWCITLKEGARFRVCGDPKHRAAVDWHHESLRERLTEWVPCDPVADDTDIARLRAIETAARAFLDADDAADETPAVATIADLHAARKALCRALGRGR